MKSVLITGAERNSGLGIARKFLKEGWSVVITSRDDAEIKAVAADLEKEFSIPCYGFQYSPLDAITDAPKLFEKIDEKGIELDSIVCVAADLGRWMDPLTVDPQAWANVLTTNVVGYFMPAREGVRQMLRTGKAKEGTIIAMMRTITIILTKSLFCIFYLRGYSRIPKLLNGKRTNLAFPFTSLL